MESPTDQPGREASTERSELPCPVCGEHSLAVDEPPQIDIMGVQPYSDMLGMGDLAPHGSLGIVCRSCGTYWRDRGAFDRGEAEPPDIEPKPPEGPAAP